MKVKELKIILDGLDDDVEVIVSDTSEIDGSLNYYKLSAVDRVLIKQDKYVKSIVEIVQSNGQPAILIH